MNVLRPNSHAKRLQKHDMREEEEQLYPVTADPVACSMEEGLCNQIPVLQVKICHSPRAGSECDKLMNYELTQDKGRQRKGST